MSRQSWAVPFLVLSGGGAVVSACVHAVSLAGIWTPMLFDLTVAAFVAVFIVWMPAFLAEDAVTRGLRWRDKWKAATRGAPRWMRRLPLWMLAYAFAVFSLFGAWRLLTGRGADRIAQLRLLSAYAAAFHAAAFSALYSYLHMERSTSR
jgi:hypothetical protein